MRAQEEVSVIIIILLMNQDVLIHYNCLEELLRVFDSRPEAGAVSLGNRQYRAPLIYEVSELCYVLVGELRGIAR